MPSFQEIWQQNRGLFECVGIVCGVGALFLAIPAPENPNAANALLEIQFIWLIFIAIGVIALLCQILVLVYKFEIRVEQRFEGKFLNWGSPTFLIGMLLLIFCISLYNYASAIYPIPLDHFFFLVGSFVSAILLFVSEYFIRKHLHIQGYPRLFILAIPSALFINLSVTLAMYGFPYQKMGNQPHFLLYHAGEILVLYVMTIVVGRRIQIKNSKQLPQNDISKEIKVT